MTVSAHFITTFPASAAWDHAHGDSANTGFARVDTAPALKPHQTVQLGTLAPGAGPVITPSGTLFVGNLDGKFLNIAPDGTIAGDFDLRTGEAFLASGVVGADGAVYVASVRKEQARDPNGTEFTRYSSRLHKRSERAGGLWIMPLPVAPVDPPPAPALAGWPIAAAPPSVWRSGGTEVVMMPVLYRYPSAAELRLLAFSTQSGAVMGNTVVGSKVFDVTGSGPDWYVPFSYNEPYTCGPLQCLRDTSWPAPGVAIAPDRRGGPPSVIVSDELSHDTVGYRFDPAAIRITEAFREAFRVHDPKRTRTSPPTVLPDGHIVLGTEDGDGPGGRVSFAGPTAALLFDAVGLAAVAAAPTRLADGRIAAIDFSGTLNVLRTARRNGPVNRRIPLVGESIASAAASCRHLFVASVGAFTTYDANTLQQVAQVPWDGGGRSSPVIGPAGHVYGIMHAVDKTDFLFVWLPPPRRPTSPLTGTACDPVVIRR
jgi:outer membrane protein assembly factor BamB